MFQQRPLDGIRILDFTWVGAGPRATRLLADYGAEVVRVESTLRLDQLRAGAPIPPGKSGPNVSSRFNNVNSSKYGVTLNLTHPQGQADAPNPWVLMADLLPAPSEAGFSTSGGG